MRRNTNVAKRLLSNARRQPLATAKPNRLSWSRDLQQLRYDVMRRVHHGPWVRRHEQLGRGPTVTVTVPVNCLREEGVCR